MKQPALEALKKLEARNIHYTAWNMRNLEQLATPQSRAEVMLSLSSENTHLGDIERSIQEARHRMWCQFIFEQHPDIDPSKRMPRPSLNVLDTACLE